MGTKNNPGRFDAYAMAEPSEPMFVLLGRDADAPRLVDTWADIRERKNEDPEKVAEARQCAEQMREFRRQRALSASTQAEALALVSLALDTTDPTLKQWYLNSLAETLGAPALRKAPPDGWGT